MCICVCAICLLVCRRRRRPMKCERISRAQMWSINWPAIAFDFSSWEISAQKHIHKHTHTHEPFPIAIAIAIAISTELGLLLRLRAQPRTIATCVCLCVFECLLLRIKCVNTHFWMVADDDEHKNSHFASNGHSSCGLILLLHNKQMDEKTAAALAINWMGNVALKRCSQQQRLLHSSQLNLHFALAFNAREPDWPGFDAADADRSSANDH